MPCGRRSTSMKIQFPDENGRCARSARGYVLAVAVVLTAGGPLFASETDSEAAEIRHGDLYRHVSFLASDTLEGRDAGSSGGRAASIYLMEELKQMELTPGGEAERFAQDFGREYRNVLAMVPGRGSLADEIILVGAHYDHVGYGRRGNSYGPIGSIHNGADDNASGTAAILEIAEAFAHETDTEGRSILFAWWDAEEIGLVGSEHWLAHPTVRLEDVRLVLNVDMIGHLREERINVHGARTAAPLRTLLSLANRESHLLLAFDRHHKRDSDHYPFYERRIPYLSVDTGKHEHYHRPTDDVDTLNYDGLVSVTRWLKETIASLRTCERLSRFRPASVVEAVQPEAPRSGQDKRSRLGISWHPREAGEMIRIRSIEPESPAARAGLLVDDVLMRFGDVKIDECRDFPSAVAAAEELVEVVVRREGGEAVVVVELGGEAEVWGFSSFEDDAEPGVAIVSRVSPGSPAEAADLRTGDRILERANGSRSGLGESLRVMTEREGRLQWRTLRVPVTVNAGGQ